MTNTQQPGADAPVLFHPDPTKVRRAIAKRSYCVLSTTSEAGRPHAAGVLYALVGDTLWASTDTDSRKARNIAASGRVGVVIPVRRVPVGPPSCVQFQTTATVVPPDDPALRAEIAAGRLKAITSHGELDLPDACFLRIDLPSRVLTYGLGMSLVKLMREPLAAAGTAELAAA
jgi:hypothetical protein